jgi:hypothetical protein
MQSLFSHLSNIIQTIPPRIRPRITRTIMSRSIRMAAPPTPHRLSDPKILLRSRIRVGAGSRRAFRESTTLQILLSACVGQLLCKRRALAEDGALPVDYVDGDDEDEGDAEEDCGGVGEMVGVVWSAYI